MDENTFMWKITHLWWILISFIFLFNGVGLIYAGFHADERLWKIEGTIYEVIVIIFMIAVNTPFNSNISSVITGIYLFSWFISIVRSFMIRNQYLEKIRHDKYQNSRYSYNTTDNNFVSNVKVAVDNNDEMNYKFNNGKNQDFNKQSEENVQSDNLTLNQSIRQVDINKASEKDLLQLPGIDINMANKIMNFRQSGRTIKSLDEFKLLLELDDYQIRQLKDYIIIAPTNNKSQRKLDL